MRQSLSTRLYSLTWQAVKKEALGQQFEVDVTACYAPTVGPDGVPNGGIGHSWLITVSIPNPLVGNPAIAVSVPIQGVVPPDAAFEAVGVKLFENCLQQRDKMEADIKAEAERPTVPVPAVPQAPRKKRERSGGHFPSVPGSELKADA